MKQFLSNLFIQVKKYSSAFWAGVLLIVGKLKELIGLVLLKVLGQNRFNSLKLKANQLNEYKNSKVNYYLDQTGQYGPLVKNLYKTLFFGLLFFAFGAFIFKTNFLWLTGKMPSVEELQNPKMNTASSILSADGVEIGKYFAENRIPVDSSDISPWVFKALISTEDKRFFEHSGIDLRRMASVGIGVLFNQDRGGGSTLSQQLAKNLYNIREKENHGLLYKIPIIKTIVYKSKEWITAVQLEQRFTKGEIATMYLNTVAFGNGAFGIKTAAKTYFNKSCADLGPKEAATLVGLLKATTYYNPIRNPKNSLRRRNTVLGLMGENNVITKEEAEAFKKEEIKLDVNIEEAYDGQGNYFKVELANFIKNWAKENNQDIDLYRDGLKIHTTIDSRMQALAENAAEKHMTRLQKEFDSQFRNSNPWTYESGKEIVGFIDTVAKRTQYYKELEKKFNNNLDSVNKYMNLKIPMTFFSWDGNKKVMMSPIDSIKYYKKFLQCGMVAMEPGTGAIKAWVGGVDYDHFKYDHVKQGRRQPGSTFKPILYTAAIDGPLNLSPCDRRQNKPIKTTWVEDGVVKTWEPKNSGQGFTMSSLSLRNALGRSVNSVAVQLTLEAKPQTVVDYARKMGITSPLDPVGSIGLGTSDVSLFEMVGAYGVFLNKGNLAKPMYITKIQDRNGKTLATFKTETTHAISAESAYLMQFMLRGNVEESGGTGTRLFNYPTLFRNNGQVGGKTGTTSNYSDAWYIGMTKDLVCGVWVGADDRSIHFKGGMGQGSRSALPMFGLFMESVYKSKDLGYVPGPFPAPSVKITKNYLGCLPIVNDSTKIIADSLFRESMTDQLESMTPDNSVQPTINFNKESGIKKRAKVDTSATFTFRKRKGSKPDAKKEDENNEDQSDIKEEEDEGEEKKRFRLFRRKN